MVADAIIASSMLQFLYGSKTKMLKTQNIISKLTQLVFETGVILMVVAIIDLTFFLSFPPQNNFFYAPSMSLSKLYSNAMLVVSRVAIAFSLDIRWLRVLWL